MKKCFNSMFLCGGVLLGVVFLFAGEVVAAKMETSSLQIKVGGSDVIRTSHSFKRVSIAYPQVADLVILSPTEVYVVGKKVGNTRIMVWADDQGKTLVDLTVTLDLTELKEKIQALYPEQQVEVHGVKNGIILAGTVSGPDIAEQILRLAQHFLPEEGEGAKGGEGTGKSGGGITNLMKIGGVQQVMLEVKFAEVSRDSQKDWQAALGLIGLGKNFTGAAGTQNLMTPITDVSVKIGRAHV